MTRLPLRPVVRAGALLLAGTLLAACGGGEKDAGESEKDRDAEKALSSGSGAADQTVCRADATALSAPYDPAFPDWSFPAQTTVYDVEDRSGVGVIVTAVSAAPFADILDHLNHQEQGVTITSGETEDNDAEANWTSDGYTGRWAIRKSGTCDGETVIQVFAAPAG
ncbi:MAG: hypothetical protein ACXVEC_12025 [Nocardioides sp.]